MIRVLIPCLIIVVNLCVPKLGLSQSDDSVEFKMELFKRGVKALKAQPKKEQAELENALESALYVDPSTLVEPLVSELGISFDQQLRVSLEHSGQLKSFDPILERMRTSELNMHIAYSFSKLAYELGCRNQSHVHLSEAVQKIFANLEQQPESDLSEILDEINYCFNLGLIHQGNNQLSFESAVMGVDDPILKDFLMADWICSIGSKSLAPNRLLKFIEKVQAKSLQDRLLVKILSEMDDDALATQTGHQLFKDLVGLHFDRAFAASEERLQSFEWQTESVNPKAISLARSSEKVIVDLCRRSGVFSFDSELFDFVLEAEAVHGGQPPGFIKKWAAAASANCLNVDEFENANVIATTYNIQLPLGELIEYAIRQNEFELVESRLSRSQKRKLIFENPKFSNESVRKQLTSEVVGDFKQLLNNTPDRKKLGWLMEYVWRAQSIKNDDGSESLVAEDEILRTFGDFKDMPAAPSAVASAYTIFLGTGTANRELLDKMMKMTPEKSQLVTKYQIRLMETQIVNAPIEERAQVREKAIGMLKRPRKVPFGNTEGKFAFAFAKIGDKEAVNQIVGRIADKNKRAWVLFQCAKAFPPNGAFESNEGYSTYSSYNVGGLF